ncbi:S8 family serine peptidase [Mesorhizobium sp. NBSH29]|uniref:S8 family serine peptidase n=1 Tax=Mesorhizobium sp. NBSH29 TaxID=2654249 RepID=UPI0035BC4A24
MFAGQALAQVTPTPRPDPNSSASAPAGPVVLPAILVDLFDPAAAPPSPNPPPVAPLANRPLLLVAPQAVSGAFVPDEVLVSINGDPQAAATVAAALGLEVRSMRQSALLGVTVARFGIPDGRPVGVVLAQLAGDARILSRAPNHIYSLQQAATIGSYAFGRIEIAAAEARGTGVRIAVIDTAADETHPALAGVIAGTFDAMEETPVADRGHGTSITGILAGIGVSPGIAPGAVIFHARAFEGGRSTMSVILSALDWAAEQDVRLINMSFVGPANDLMARAVGAARERGILLVAAAGNNGPQAPYGYPAAYPEVIAVTATDDEDGLMEQANRGPYVYVAAPGVQLVAPVPGGTDLVTGTSFAAAVVSGAIANLLSAAPDHSADWVEHALASTAHDLGPAGRDTDFGFGLINTKAAAAAR